MGTTEFSVPAGVPQIQTRREFAAPRDLVYRAYTEPDLLVRWLGPRRFATVVETLENCHSGAWRFVHRDADGNEFAFRGVIHGTPSPEGIVRTSEFEGMPGHVSLESVHLEERDGRTIAFSNVVYQSVEDRDGTLQAGMQHGFDESMARLDELLAVIVAPEPANHIPETPVGRS